MLGRITALFPLWALLCVAAALIHPAAFTVGAPAMLPLLMIIMLGMGMGLSPADFRGVAQQPRLIFCGLLLQYTVMPAAAWIAAWLLRLDPESTVGMILVGASAGGTASNVITYLARGNLALSVTLTACSTLLAVVLTPALTWLLVGRSLPVPALSMLTTVGQIALGPVIVGMLLRWLLRAQMPRIEPWLPLVSMGAICAIIGVIVALNRSSIASTGAAVALAVLLHHVLGLTAGYFAARRFGAGEADARTIAIEVGMQNSGLSVALAMKYFSPAAAR
jgi:BASS family bile acid:Na+ symporter